MAIDTSGVGPAESSRSNIHSSWPTPYQILSSILFARDFCRVRPALPLPMDPSAEDAHSAGGGSRCCCSCLCPRPRRRPHASAPTGTRPGAGTDHRAGALQPLPGGARPSAPTADSPRPSSRRASPRVRGRNGAAGVFFLGGGVDLWPPDILYPYGS
jgi:hypothetical protein